MASGGRRPAAGEQVEGCCPAVLVGVRSAAHQRLLGQAGRRQRVAVAAQPLLGRADGVGPADQRDAAMATLDQQPRRLERAEVVIEGDPVEGAARAIPVEQNDGQAGRKGLQPGQVDDHAEDLFDLVSPCRRPH